MAEMEVTITLKDNVKELLDVCKDVAELRDMVPESLQYEANEICQRISQCIKRTLKLETP